MGKKKYLLINRFKLIHIHHVFCLVILIPSLCYSNSPRQANLPLLQVPFINLEKLETEEDSMAFANDLMVAKRSNDAINITSALLEKLNKKKRYNSDFGLKVRFIHGSALIHASQNVEVIEFLWKLKDDSYDHENWFIFAESCRVISNMLAYSDRKEQSLAVLIEAQVVINKYQVKEAYPGFYIRLSSWYRLYGNADTSLYYANEAVKYAIEFKKVFQEADGNLLKGLHYDRLDEYEKALAYYQRSITLFKKIGDNSSISSVYINVAKLLMDDKKYVEAISNLDSAAFYNPSQEYNNIQRAAGILKSKSEAYEKMGMLDSALVYSKKAHQIELQFLRQENLDKVVEIDNVYNVEKKTNELKIEKTQNIRISLLAFLLLFLAVGLVYYYNKLRKVNNLTIKQTEELQKLDLAKSRFFANVSHELRTPLTLILGPLNILLQEGNIKDRQKKLLTIASKSGKDLMRLINEILDLGKLDSGRMQLHFKKTRLKIFFQSCLVQFDSIINQKNIQYTINNSIEEDLLAEIDQGKCRQIVNNLVSNAVKHTPENGEVKVSLKIQNSNIHIQVSNSGEGIKQSDLPYIFERYYQGGKQSLGGTGIGLALCQEYVTLFKGQISASNGEDNLTVFEINFPLALTQSEEPEEQMEIQEEAPFAETNGVKIESFSKEKPSILLVEDNLSLQQYISMILEQDYHVVKSSNGQEALKEIASNDNFDLILSDLMMPIMDGYQLVESLKSKEATQDIPMIMLTARADLEDKLKALRIGVDDYITKPFDKEELLVRIANLLRNRAVRTEVALEEAENGLAELNILNLESQWMQRFEEYIQNNCGDPNLNIPEIAEEFAMSESTLLRQLKKQSGLSTIQFIQEVRLRKALKILQNGEPLSIKELAYEVGYKDHRTFSRGFRKHFGKLPSEMSQVF